MIPMNILFLSPWFPYPTENGSKIRIYNLIKALSKKHEVRLISFVREGEQVNPEGLKGVCTLEAMIPWREFAPRSWKSIIGAFYLIPRSVVDTYSRQMAKQLNRSIKQETPDLIIASEINTAIYGGNKLGIPCIYEDLELGLISQHWSRSRNPIIELRGRLSRIKIQSYTMKLVKQYDVCTVVSQKEKALLSQIININASIHVVPNGVDLDYNHPGEIQPELDTLIFNGALTYSANLDAMQYFLRDIFPLIRSRVPDINLTITGSNQGVNLSSLQLDDHVKLLGYIDDIRLAVAKAWACIVPLRLGGGTRLKVLEALALGTPVVATPKAVEGLDVIPDIHVLIANDTIEFANQVVRLVNDPYLRSRIAEFWTQTGRRTIRLGCNWH